MDLRHASPAAGEAAAPTVDTGHDLTPSAERRRDRETLTLIAICLLLMGAVVGLWSTAVPPRTVDPLVTNGASIVAQAAPSFVLPDLTGTMVRLSDYQGKVVLLNIWATWCPPCVRETPRLVRLADRYQEAGLVVLGVNATYQDDEPAVRAFAERMGITYPVLLDATNALGPLYPTRLMPSTYLIDQTGIIRAVRVGEVDEQHMAEQIEQLLTP